MTPDPKPKAKKKPKHRNLGPWRAAVLARRGERCRNCGDPQVEADHLIPRSQGGDDVVENGLPLCGVWSKLSPFPGGCHKAKTEKRLRISREMLDPDQIAWLAERGWVRWEAGEPVGQGWRSFV